jgi:hypothetical protein
MSNQDEDASQLLTLADEILRYIASYGDVQDLCRIESTCNFFHESLDYSKIWKARCDTTFDTSPRYKCQKHGYPCQSYKESFEYLYKEIRRTKMQVKDLVSLRWFFNFHPIAGGRGRETLSECQFSRLAVTVNEFPPLPYTLQEGTILRISDFPPHEVSRLPDGEWLIVNEFVTFVSSDADGTINYRARGFQ